MGTVFDVNSSRVSKTRGPRWMVERVLGLVDFEVNPLVIRRYLKFVVVRHAIWGRVYEHFHDVAVPKLPTLLGRVFTFIYIQRQVSTAKSKVDVRG